MTSKAELRKIYLSRRGSINHSDKMLWDDAIFHRLVALPVVSNAHLVMSYVSFRNEVDTWRFLEHRLNERMRVAVPVTDLLKVNLIPCEITDLHSDLHIGAFKVPEPRHERMCPVTIREIDLHIIPGVAFSPSGHRIGFSRGFYDRFLSDAPPDAARIGLSYECQMVESFPADEWDIPVHYIVTEDRIIECNGK
jgi:5-formyltetrahydrofolate cyclo-ligase